MIDELPDGWALTTIEETCDLNPKHPNTINDSTPVSFVPMAAVSEVDGRITGTETRNYGDVKKGFTHFADGDVIFAKITPCMENGKAASVRGLVNGLACGTTEFFVFRSRGAVDQDYLFHFIRQESYRRAARATMQSGVGQARVPKEFVLNTELPLPPLAEQRRIVAKIEELTARSRSARAALAEVPTLLEQFRQSVLSSAFRGALTADWRAKHPHTEPVSDLLARIRTERRKQWEAKYPKKKYVEPDPVDDSDLQELPEGWCWVALDQIINGLQQGWSPKCEIDGSTAPEDWAVIKTTSIQAMSFHPNENKRLPSTLPPVEDLQIRSGDILITRAGPRVRAGVCCLVHEVRNRLILCDKAYRFRAIEPIAPDFVELALNSPRLTRAIDVMKTGISDSGVNLTQDRFLRLEIPLPPVAEQVAIVTQVKHAWSRIAEVERSLERMSAELDQLDQSILAKAFRGELVPQDSDDEPASALLERLRTAQAAAPSNGKPRRKQSREQ